MTDSGFGAKCRAAEVLDEVQPEVMVSVQPLKKGRSD